LRYINPSALNFSSASTSSVLSFVYEYNNTKSYCCIFIRHIPIYLMASLTTYPSIIQLYKFKIPFSSRFRFLYIFHTNPFVFCIFFFRFLYIFLKWIISKYRASHGL
jgi:hypothetical protein